MGRVASWAGKSEYCTTISFAPVVLPAFCVAVILYGSGYGLTVVATGGWTHRHICHLHGRSRALVCTSAVNEVRLAVESGGAQGPRLLFANLDDVAPSPRHLI